MAKNKREKRKVEPISRRRLSRSQLRAKADMKMLQAMEDFNKFMEGVAIAIEDIEKEIKKMQGAMTIFNCIIDILMEKGIITHEQVKERLRTKKGVIIDEGSTIRSKDTEPNIESGDGPTLTISEEQGEGGDSNNHSDEEHGYNNSSEPPPASSTDENVSGQETIIHDSDERNSEPVEVQSKTE